MTAKEALDALAESVAELESDRDFWRTVAEARRREILRLTAGECLDADAGDLLAEVVEATREGRCAEVGGCLYPELSRDLDRTRAELLRTAHRS